MSHATKHRSANAGVLAFALVLVTGCNSLLDNRELLVDDTLPTLPERQPERDSASDAPSDPSAATDAGASADAALDAGADADADADAGATCPQPTCTTTTDCTSGEQCIYVTVAEAFLTRFCARACDAGTDCASDQQCVGSPMHCVPKAPICGRTCNFVCSQSCADLSSDETNCGACGHLCPAGKTCMSGACF